MNATLRLIQKNRDTVMSVSDLLYGDGAWEISKRMTQETRERTQARVGLASNVVGITAGAAGLGAALKDERLQNGGKVAGRLYKVGTGIENTAKKTKVGEKYYNFVKKPKVAAGMAAGAVGLQALNLGGDAVANRVLARSAKKQPVEKAAPSVTWRGEISKMDTDKRQVFGWASIVEVNGEPVVDLQGDVMTIEEIEKAAYNYVRSSRKGGNQHRRDGAEPVHVSDMIESFIVTEEKKQQMGLPADTPTGWWVGFQVNDDETWAQVKNGERREFSIHGSGVRKEVAV